jgi:hypothetical protein
MKTLQLFGEKWKVLIGTMIIQMNLVIFFKMRSMELGSYK